jgi:hypothetical protein
MAADTMVMLDLLQEAGQEAVTLDELSVAGVQDPARALLELELLGLGIQRVLVRGDHAERAFECVRLAAAAPEQPGGSRSPARGIVLLAVLLALVALVLRRS